MVRSYKIGWATPFGSILSSVTTTTWLLVRAVFVDLSLLVKLQRARQLVQGGAGQAATTTPVTFPAFTRPLTLARRMAVSLSCQDHPSLSLGDVLETRSLLNSFTGVSPSHGFHN